MIAGASAWGTCQPFSEIYASGKELCEKMWNDSFEYQADEAAAYSMWFFDAVNPNNAVAASNGKVESPDTCALQYFHKGADGGSSAPSPEGAAFTECHPWKDNACCHEATVVTPQAMNEGYGDDYHWDRCGPLSNACEQFFIQEACFYECSPHAGQYRRYSDAEVAAFAAFKAVDGNPGDPCYADPVPADDDAAYQGTFEHEGVAHQASVFYGDGCYGPNKWQMYKMPIKASYCDAFWTACQHDLFCGGGDFFSCAADYRSEEAAREAEALDAALAPFAAHIQDEVRAANISAAAATVMAQELQDAEDKEDLPEWAIVLIAVLGGVGLCCLLSVCVLVSKEKAGKPMFVDLDNAPASKSASSTKDANHA